MVKTRLGHLRRLRRTLWQPVRSGADILLYIVHQPGEIVSIVADPDFDQPTAMRVLWIVDSFWSERTPTGLMGNFDLVIYMQKAEAAFYERAAGGKALYIGWGADVLDLGFGGSGRDIDVLRVGRQPDDWEDDLRSSEIAAAQGLVFHGRPPADISYSDLTKWYARSRYIIAFSNLAAPAPYTHPTKAYFTGRWTDALAGGAVVAGIAPMQDSGIAGRLWEGACLEFDGVDLVSNMETLARARTAWTPEVAEINYRNALLRLDWRHGIKVLADHLGLVAPTLEHELERLHARAEDNTTSGRDFA